MTKAWKREENAKRQNNNRNSGGGRGRGQNKFGTGTVGGDRNWTPPVHGTTADGRPVTASFGQGPRNQGETLIADGHVENMNDFYGKGKSKGHDHFDRNGNSGKSGDRGKSTS